MPQIPDNTIQFPNLDLVLNIPRIAIEFLGFGVYFYGIIICSAIVLGILYAVKSAPKVGLLPDTVFDAAFWGVALGVVGARTYYVVFSILGEGKQYDSLAQAAFGLRDGGLAFYGGAIGAFAGVAIVMRMRKLRFAPVTDLMGTGFLLGLGIGRWGNFFNQEAFGAPTAGELPWGMMGDRIAQNAQVRATFIETVSGGGDPHSVLVHPCFLYESLWCLLGFAILHFYMKKFQSFDGEMLLLFMVWYGSGRAFIESLRLDSLRILTENGDPETGYRVSQLLAIASASVALCLFVYFKLTKVQKHAYMRFKDTQRSEDIVQKHLLKVKIEREKSKALMVFKRTQRDIHDPFASGIDDDE